MTGGGSVLIRILVEQGRRPSGRLGWVVAATMSVLMVPLNARMARLAQIGRDDHVPDVACGTGPSCVAMACKRPRGRHRPLPRPDHRRATPAPAANL